MARCILQVRRRREERENASSQSALQSAIILLLHRLHSSNAHFAALPLASTVMAPSSSYAAAGAAALLVRRGLSTALSFLQSCQSFVAFGRSRHGDPSAQGAPAPRDSTSTSMDLGTWNWSLRFQQHDPFSTLIREHRLVGITAPFLRSSYLPQEVLFGREVRRMSLADRVQKRKKIITKRDLKKQLKRESWATGAPMPKMGHEQKLLERIEKAQEKIAVLEEELKKYEATLPHMSDHHREPLTAEELHFLKKIGKKNKNYVPVGVRGIFGGVIQNMHLHWKQHETVQVCCDSFPKDQIAGLAEQLEILSGGIVVDIVDGHTVIIYRGKNYTRPKSLIPINTLTKRKALLKAKCQQAMKSHKQNIEELEQELKSYREYRAQQATNATIL